MYLLNQYQPIFLIVLLKEFVRTNYEVDFPMFSKVEVQGENIHPLWKHIIGK